MRLRAACYYETEKSAGFPPFVRLNFVVECKVNYCKVRIEVLNFVSWRKIVVIPNVMRWVLAFSMHNTDTKTFFRKVKYNLVIETFEDDFSLYASFNYKKLR